MKEFGSVTMWAKSTAALGSSHTKAPLVGLRKSRSEQREKSGCNVGLIIANHSELS